MFNVLFDQRNMNPRFAWNPLQKKQRFNVFILLLSDNSIMYLNWDPCSRGPQHKKNHLAPVPPNLKRQNIVLKKILFTKLISTTKTYNLVTWSFECLRRWLSVRCSHLVSAQFCATPLWILQCWKLPFFIIYIAMLKFP